MYKTKSIIHLATVHPRYDIRIFLKECITLAQHGCDVSIVVADGKGNEVKEGVKIVDAGKKTDGRLSRMTRTVNRIYKKAKELDGDLYHFHDPELIPVGLKLKRYGKKIIYDAHEDYSEDILTKEWIPTRIIRKIVVEVFNRIERNAVKKFDGVITATPRIRQKFENQNINTLDINNYPILNAPTIRKTKQIGKSRNVAYIGTIGIRYGIIESVSALSFTDSTLILAGKFYNTRDYDLATSTKGWERVDYRGQVDRSEITTILSESVAGLVLYHPGPNHDYSQPNKLFEYMAAGLPVIGSNFSLWKEIIEKNECGICVNPLNPIEIAAAINWVLQNPSAAASMGRNGLNAVLEKYNWEVESQKLVRFYEELLK